MARMNKFTIDFLIKFENLYIKNSNRVGMKYYQLTEKGKTPVKKKNKSVPIGLLYTSMAWHLIHDYQIDGNEVRLTRLKMYKHENVVANISANEIKLSVPNMEMTFEYNMVIDLNQNYKYLEEKTMNNEMNNAVVTNEVVNTPATIDEVTVAPVIPTEAYVDTDSVTAPSMIATASPITSVADFLAMVHSRRESLSEGKIKLSLDEVMERLGGIVTVKKIEKCSNEGRNFFVVQIDEQTYMYSFKMMTALLAKWVQACGGVENLNNMLAQTEIRFQCSKSEYMGKTYTRCDVI